MSRRHPRARTGDLSVHGARVELRPLERADHPLLRIWQNDPEIARWMDYRHPFNDQDLREDLERAQREGEVFIVQLDGTAIGKCGLNGFRLGDGTCSLYVYIGDKELWGQGLGHDIVATLCRYAFDELGTQRVELSLLEGNARARRVYERCGFAVDARRRGRDTRGRSTLIMRLDRPAFERAVAAYRS
jgi:RimJ/RimL family protein N-acetyltransferase